VRLTACWRKRAGALRLEARVLFLAVRHPRTPWYAKALALVVLGYALSPIDLIPDFLPVLGQLDDLLLIPAGLALVRRLIPASVLAECREKARARPNESGRRRPDQEGAPRLCGGAKPDHPTDEALSVF